MIKMSRGDKMAKNFLSKYLVRESEDWGGSSLERANGLKRSLTDLSHANLFALRILTRNRFLFR